MRSYLIGFVAMVFSTLAVAQGQLVNPDIVPQVSSPEAAELGKHISVPVSLNTGTPNISIPLYTITYGGMQVPVSLNYDASGVKVDELASNVGLKWSLDYGGAVTRIVKGGRDEGINNATSPFGYLKGYYKDYGLSTLPVPFEGQNSDNQASLLNFMMNGLSSGQNDGQPDLFSFNALGNTGRFFFDQNRNLTTFTEGDYKVSVLADMLSSNSNFSEFTITTSSGLLMKFGSNGLKERSSISDAFTAPDIDNAWMLSTITNLSNNDSITFNYTAENFNDVIVSNRNIGALIEVAGGIGGIVNPDALTCLTSLPNNHLSYSYSESQSQRISSIVAGKTTIDFIASSRQDIYSVVGNPVQKIDQIIVKYDGICVKKFRLNYDYFNAVGEIDGAIDQIFENTAKKRLKLVSLEEMDCNDNVVKKHEFFYDETNPLPVRNSYAKDKWGFYNGKILNQSLYPKISPDCSSYWWTADRSISPTHTKAGTLTKIIYPTKGSVAFEYENHVSDEVVTPNNQIGWLTQSDINSYTSLGNVVEYNFVADASAYKVDVTLQNGVPWYHPSPNPCQTSGFEIVKATELKNNTTGVVEYQRFYGSLVVNNLLTDTYSHTQEFNGLQSGASYTLRIYSMSDSNNSKCFTAQANLSKLGSLPPTAQDFLVGGLRIKKVTFRDAANIVLTSNYTYESPKLVDNPQFLFEGNYNVDLTIPGITSFDNVISPEIYELAFEYRFGTFRLFSVGTNPRQIDFMGSHVSYQKVTEKNSEGKNVYHYYPAQTYLENSNFHTTNFYPNIPVFQSSLAGRLMRQETYDANNQLLRESQNVYDIHLVDKDIEALVASTILQEAVVIVPFEFYKVKPEYSVLKNTITTDYFQGTPVQTTTEYFYEGQEHHQPTKIVTVDSKGQQQITENQYPPDVPYKPYMPDLIAQNRIATPIVSKSLQGTSLLSQQEIIFSKSPLTSNFVLPTEAMIAKGLGSLESRVKYEKYDSQGNILQYSLTDGTKSSFLWGYDNQFPVARVDNATYDQILSSGVVLSTVNNPATSDAAMRTELQKIRAALPDAQTTTYTYDPLVGVTSITDPRGYTSYFDYDPFNRLHYVKDAESLVQQEIRYHYALPEIIATTAASATTVNSGAVVSFTTTASGGTGNFSYKWTVSNATLNQTTTTGTGSFSVTTTSSHAPAFTLTCEITDTQTNEKVTTSVQVTVNTFSPLTATTTASSTSVNSGATVSFTTTPTGGSGSFSYKWTVSNANLNQVTTTTTGSFSVTTTTSHAPSFTLSCEVTDTQTGQKVTTSTQVTVSTSFLPLKVGSILISPSGTTNKSVGQSVQYSISVSGGSGNYRYQWSKSNSGGTFSFINNTNTLTETVTSADCASYTVTCVVTDLTTGTAITKSVQVSVSSGCGTGGNQQ